MKRNSPELKEIHGNGEKHRAIHKSEPKFSDIHQYYEKYTKVLRKTPKYRALEMPLPVGKPKAELQDDEVMVRE